MKAKFWQVNEVRIEPNFGDGMFTKLITPVFTKHYNCLVEENRKASGQKEKRIIDTLEPLLSRHRLILNTSVIHSDYKQFQEDSRYSLFYQLTRLCAERGALAHDDRVEALAEACYYWVEAMSVDQSKEAEDRLEEALDMWMDPDRGIFYTPPTPPKPGSKFNNADTVRVNILEGFFKSYVR